MIDIALLDDLLDRMRASGLTELEVQQGEIRIAMRLGAAVDAAPSKPVPVLSEGIGTFRPAHPRRPGLSVKPGDTVPKGMVLGYLEIGLTLTAITAPAAGILSEIIAKDGDLLGFGAHVFTLEARA